MIVIDATDEGPADALVRPIAVRRHDRGTAEDVPDLVAVEDPLRIVVEHGPEDDRVERGLGLTMRTPGHDLELVVGWLLAEGVVRASSEIASVRACRRSTEGDAVRVLLHPRVEPRFVSSHGDVRSSSCGVCGRAAIEDLVAHLSPHRDRVPVEVGARVLRTLPALLARAQTAYRHTGGLHAAAYFTAEGSLVLLREDVGRHNALDKLVGAWALASPDRVPPEILVMSSRASFEIVQKAARAGVRIVAAIGPASSLAVETATAVGVTLVGFLREDRFNVYAHPERIR
jgi:FdhD protein